MSLQSQIIADTTIYLNADEFAEAVTYTPVSGEAANINMVIDRDAALDGDELGDALSALALGCIGMADVAAVNYGDVITATSPAGATETWTVRRIKSSDMGMYVVVMVRDLRIK